MNRKIPVEQAIEHDQAMPIRVVIRNYFSGYFLWTARQSSLLAQSIESAHEGEPRFDIEHRGYVLSSVLASVAFLESNINELFQDAHDGHASHLSSLSTDTRRMMAELWISTDEGTRLRPLDKYKMLLVLAGHEPLDPGSQPCQDAVLVVQLRNALAHFQPEDLSADEPHKMKDRLRGKFPDNRLMAESGNPWWPDHALGCGCADWVHRSAKALADRVMKTVGVETNYMHHEKTGWLTPKPRA